MQQIAPNLLKHLVGLFLHILSIKTVQQLQCIQHHKSLCQGSLSAISRTV